MTPIRMAQYATKHGHATGKLLSMLTNPDVEVVGVYEPDPEQRERMQATGSLLRNVHWFEDKAEMLDEPSIVAIASEGLNSESLEQTAEIVAAGKHVWYDKPAGQDWPRWQAVMADAQAQKPEQHSHDQCHEDVWQQSEKPVQPSIQFSEYQPDIRIYLVHGHALFVSGKLVLSGAGKQAPQNAGKSLFHRRAIRDRPGDHRSGCRAWLQMHRRRRRRDPRVKQATATRRAMPAHRLPIALLQLLWSEPSRLPHATH